MSIIYVFVGLIGLFMICGGLAPGADPLYFFIGLILAIAGALSFTSAQRRKQRQDEERRHREMLDAMYRGQYRP